MVATTSRPVVMLRIPAPFATRGTYTATSSPVLTSTRMLRWGRVAVGVASAVFATTHAASADKLGECHTVAVDFLPAPELQIVAWIEDGSGSYVDTAFITAATGIQGFGNRQTKGPRRPQRRPA